MRRPRLLDLFCGAGGAAMGYHRAGFDVVGVDIKPQPRYPFEFIQADGVDLAAALGMGDWMIENLYGEEAPLLRNISAVHASPPCQDHSATKDLGERHGTAWMLGATRKFLIEFDRPWAIENVQGAPLASQPDLLGSYGAVLCGCMFGELRGLIYEDRLFETSFPVPQLSHCFHRWSQTKMGRPPKPGECMQVTGHFSGVEEAQRRMGIDWMTQAELAQAIPPAFTQFIGEQLLEHLAVVSS